MIKIRQVKINVDKFSDEVIKKQISYRLNVNVLDINSYIINKKSLDARKKPQLFFILELLVDVNNEEEVLSRNNDIDVLKYKEEKYIFNVTGNKKMENIIIVGSGPSGLMSAYLLARHGYKPTIIERGKPVEEREKDVEKFFETGKLNTESNIQFGEGGAGTFSDGKLNTLTKDKENRFKYLFDSLVKFGAPENISYEQKPHIGTDILRNVVINLRKEIISLGGKFLFNTKLTDILVENNKLKSIVLNDNDILDCDALVLAIGHSARDTFEMLYNKGINMESKPFAVGVRVQHKQEMINESQIGVKSHPILENQNYKLTYQTENRRGVYTFCMCPGGYVVNSSSEENGLVINGMSYHDRDSENANSAVIVTIDDNDFGNNPLDGIKFQKVLEQKTFALGSGKIPTSLYVDFKNNASSKNTGNVNPVFKGEYMLTNIRNIFPEYINESLIEAIESFGKKIKGFNNDDTLISVVESRTSSPVKIIRNENFESNIRGIFPIGEGAGYAGGITSSFIDGMKLAEKLAENYSCD